MTGGRGSPFDAYLAKYIIQHMHIQLLAECLSLLFNPVIEDAGD